MKPVAKHACKRHDTVYGFSESVASLVAVMMLAPLARVALAQQQPTAAEAQRQLLQLTVPDSVETEVPTAIRNAISNFKRVLVFQTNVVVTKLPVDVTAASVKQHLSANMPAPAVGKISDEQW